jgi:hypothetical protein
MVDEDRKEEIKRKLTVLLNECLRSVRQEGSFEVEEVDLKNEKFRVVFDIVEVPEDGYVGFVGY